MLTELDKAVTFSYFLLLFLSLIPSQSSTLLNHIALVESAGCTSAGWTIVKLLKYRLQLLARDDDLRSGNFWFMLASYQQPPACNTSVLHNL